MTSKANQWEVKQLSPDDSAAACELLTPLAANEIAAIQIAEFLPRQNLDTIIQNMSKQSIKWYENKQYQQGRIGISTTEYHHMENGMKKYFDLAPQATAARDEIFQGTPDPIGKLLEFFSKGHQTSVATEPEMQNRQYFAGLIRAMGAKSTLHFDYAPNQLPGWSVSDAEQQYGLVLHLQTATQGGELTVYDRPWEQEDDLHNNDIGQKGTYGFTEGFLGDTPHASVSPSAGDLIVFKTRNFHQVEEIKSDQPRLALTTFMTLRDGALSFWS